MTKILFLLVTKRALTSLSFMASLRNGHEVEASRLRDFKFDYFFNININIHAYKHTSLPYFSIKFETQIEKLVLLGNSQLFYSSPEMSAIQKKSCKAQIVDLTVAFETFVTSYLSHLFN